MLIQVRGLTKVYDLGAVQVRALDGVDLDIPHGSYAAIMGASGSGKSTLMNMIGCLDTPTGGTYHLEGELVSSMDDDQLAAIRNRRIGFVFQTFNLLPRSDAFHNVELPLIYAGVARAERKERTAQALESVGLGDRMKHRPNELSGGQRQRVAIARALVTQPNLILADEPTGNLDSKTSHEIMETLNGIHARGNTVILVTHEDDIAAHASRTIRLHDGRIASDTGGEVA